tara:strand:+ start:1851 stop:4226 length:2376 start_codon:yes stop_codon:yes gene_type:complete
MARQPRQQPIGFYGKFTPTGVDNSAAQRMQALAGLGETVAGLATQFGKAKAVEAAPAKAELAVAKAREEGTELKLKSGLAWGGNAYNNAAIGAYYSGITVDMQNAMLDSQAKNPDDLIAYQTEVDAKISGLLKNAPEIVQAKAGRYYEQANGIAVRAINKAAKIKTDEKIGADLLEGAETLRTTISNLSREGMTDQVIESVAQLKLDMQQGIEAGVLDQVKTNRFLSKVKDDIVIQQELGKIDRTLLNEDLPVAERIINGKTLVETLRTTELADLDATQKAQLIDKIEAEISQVENNYLQEQNKLSADEIKQLGDLNVAITNNDISDSDALAQIYKMREDGVIKTASQFSTLVNKVRSASAAQQNKQIGMANVGAVVAGDRPVTDAPITQASVDDFYEQMLPGLSDYYFERIVQQTMIVQQTRFVPTMLKQELRNDLLSGDINKISAAADTMDRILEIPGQAAAFTTQETAFAEQVALNMEYMDGEKAIEMARRNTDPTNKADIDARKLFIKDNKKKFSESYYSEVESAFTGMWSDLTANDINKNDMIADYGKLVEANFKAGTTLEGSRTKAMAQIQANWNESSFGFMKYRPEDYYSVGGDVSYLKDDLYNMLEESYTSQGLTFKKEDIFLKSDSITAREANDGQPSYQVFVRLDDGTLGSPSFMGENGKVLNRYKPVEEKAAQVKVVEAENIIASEADIEQTESYKSTRYQDAAKGTIFENERSSAELDARFRSVGLAETIDRVASAADPYVYSPGEAMEDMLTAAKGASDAYISKVKKNVAKTKKNKGK